MLAGVEVPDADVDADTGACAATAEADADVQAVTGELTAAVADA